MPQNHRMHNERRVTGGLNPYVKYRRRVSRSVIRLKNFPHGRTTPDCLYRHESQMRPPGGELTFYTALGMLYGVGATIAGFAMPMPGYFPFAAIIGLPSLAAWFEQRWAGLVLAIILVVTIPLALLALVYLDDTMLERLIRLVRIGIAGHFALVAYQWYQDG